MIKTYTELSRFRTFEERFKYLAEGGIIGEETFGGSRLINQKFYRSKEWRRIRDIVIVRDRGLDLGVEGHLIYGGITIHHMIPLTKDDILYRTKFLTDPEYMICTSHQTHNAIHYGNSDNLPKDYVPRSPNDTCPWR